MSAADTLFSSAGATAFLTFNSPGTGNAMTWAMYDALAAACDRVDANHDVRAFVIRGSGGVFSTGTDIRQFTDFSSGADGLAYERRLEACLSRLEAVAVPTIAQVEGPAVGAGCAIAFACDLRVCTATARFGVPIARTLGNSLSVENCARLVEHIGLARTKDLLITGRLLDAAEASEIGLVTRMAELKDLDRVVDDLAGSIARNAPITIRAMKEALRRVSIRRQLDLDGFDRQTADCYGSADFREGVAAFLEKRSPVFKNL